MVSSVVRTCLTRTASTLLVSGIETYVVRTPGSVCSTCTMTFCIVFHVHPPTDSERWRNLPVLSDKSAKWDSDWGVRAWSWRLFIITEGLIREHREEARPGRIRADAAFSPVSLSLSALTPVLKHKLCQILLRQRWGNTTRLLSAWGCFLLSHPAKHGILQRHGKTQSLPYCTENDCLFASCHCGIYTGLIMIHAHMRERAAAAPGAPTGGHVLFKDKDVASQKTSRDIIISLCF